MFRWKEGRTSGNINFSRVINYCLWLDDRYRRRGKGLSWLSEPLELFTLGFSTFETGFHGISRVGGFP
jgi:hypothetical protein